jgi:PHD/YefM family antitoxin component YafN of YafNO toxin-antitoxin module
MSNHVQVIEQDGKPAFYVVPAALWERMREAAEDAEDIADLERFEREDDGVRYPAAVAMAMAEGDAGELADALGHIAKARSVRLVAVPKGAVAQPRQR